ncbi:hypothetical protein [Pseudomonas viridiflava]|uniref:hypothetical protein n=1 Tax=Pseudomonas viridiflava TaxID=33069 RepID=UPI000F02389E|nr:hypothetical protein [Pseudomonas viridiflava]
MNKLLKEFADRFTRSDQSMGQIFYNDPSSASADEPLPFSLNGEIELFYRHLKMAGDPTVGGDFYIQFFTIDQLTSAQDGWLGPDNESFGWKKSFIVFADRNGDALVFDSATEEPEIYGSIQKRSFKIADSLFIFLRALIIGINIEEDEFNGDTREDDMSPKQVFINRLESEISKVGNALDVKGFMRFYFA